MSLKNRLDGEIDWRISEIALVRTNHKTRNLSDIRCEILLKYSVVSIYALLEGFVTKAFEIYIEEINQKICTKKDVETSILLAHMEKELGLFKARKQVQKKIELVSKLESFFDEEEIILRRRINTGNINLDNLNGLLITYHLESIEDKKIRDGLNKLLKFRNSIAHGETGLKVDDEVLGELINVIIKTMDLIVDHMVRGFNNTTYLREKC